MTIKKTQKKGISITNGKVEAILKPDQVTIVRLEHNESSHQPKDFVISGPGEYEIGGMTVFAHENYPAFVIEAEAITVVYLPNPANKLSESEISDFEHVDILMIPGKSYAITEQLASPVIIPISDINEFIEKTGGTIPEITSSFTIKSPADLPEETLVVNLG